jgi:hypothetical protein
VQQLRLHHDELLWLLLRMMRSPGPQHCVIMGAMSHAA